MRVAALYDIHGNLPALEAVMKELRWENVDGILIGGDVLPGPLPRETMQFIRSLNIPFKGIIGNGDREVLACRMGEEPASVPPRYLPLMKWVAEQITDEDAALLSSWPAKVRIEIGALGEVFFCHATPRNDTEIFTRNTPDEVLEKVFGAVDQKIAVCGHTHMQFDRFLSRLRLINAGSVGMPFGAPGAYWLLIGPDIQLRRTEYDFAQAAERIKSTEYPQAQDFAERSVLAPPSEEAMLETFSRVAVIA